MGVNYSSRPIKICLCLSSLIDINWWKDVYHCSSDDGDHIANVPLEEYNDDDENDDAVLAFEEYSPWENKWTNIFFSNKLFR